MEIDFSFEKEALSFKMEEKEISNWILQIIQLEKKQVGNISYFFCSDEYLLKINQKYLNHDNYTDIITFDYVEGDIISGDIMISLDRLKENALKFHVSFTQELHRVMAHGILHLIGYKDKTAEEKALMREKEDFCLTLQPSK